MAPVPSTKASKFFFIPSTFLLFAGILVQASLLQAKAGPALEKKSDGILLRLPEGFLRVRFYSPSIARVTFAKDRKSLEGPSLCVLPPSPDPVPWTLASREGILELQAEGLRLSLDPSTGRILFRDGSGRTLLEEKERALREALVQGERTYHVLQTWEGNEGEALYGLGQNQLGSLDLKGLDLDLWQHNTNLVVPYLASSRGYGILWDNPSFTRFGDLGEFEPIPPSALWDRDHKPGGLTLTLEGSQPHPAPSGGLEFDSHPKQGEPRPPSRTWEGYLRPGQSGLYQILCRSNGGVRLWLDGKELISHWRQGWLTDQDQVKVPLEAGKTYPLRIRWDNEQGTTFKLQWKIPRKEMDTRLWSEVGRKVDYYFVSGGGLDGVVAGYRTLTGKAPLMPDWAFGLWQSRQRYEAQTESLQVVQRFRELGIPFDNIVQDWRYWPDGAWGSHRFDPSRFPDPEGWIQKLHQMHAHVMLSVWGKFYPGSDNFKEMERSGFLYPPLLKEGVRDWLGYPYSFYDAFNPKARSLFWSQIDRQLFRKGIDAWWMDSTEPDLVPSPPDRERVAAHMDPTWLGTGASVLNAYPLQNSRGVYEGQRASAPDQRVFILTRSGFAGSQHYASALWSGDITADWKVFAEQVPAGLGLSLSGIPYWTTDIGGYTLPRRFAYAKPGSGDEEEWRELNVRWFQFAAFCPLLRAHGELRKREMWEFGGADSPAFKAMLKFDRLRYRLFPYLYSLAGEVTRRDGTFLRPLVMDFPGEERVLDLGDEYLFGKALLVAPVTRFKARSRALYLPRGAAWYDFWTGKPVPSGDRNAEAPLDVLPLFVRAGSILPMGPEIQYIGEKPQDPLLLIVYAGADGDFTLYEDDGGTYGYEKGEFSAIQIHWDDRKRVLTLGDRSGSFPGMLGERTFQVILCTRDRPCPFSFDPRPGGSLHYKGSRISLPL